MPTDAITCASIGFTIWSFESAREWSPWPAFVPDEAGIFPDL